MSQYKIMILWLWVFKGEYMNLTDDGHVGIFEHVLANVTSLPFFLFSSLTSSSSSFFHSLSFFLSPLSDDQTYLRHVNKYFTIHFLLQRL